MALKKTGLQPEFKLGFKIVKRPGVTSPQELRLEHTTEGHNKYYEMSILNQGNSPGTNFTVYITYGKIGVLGGVKKHGYGTLEEAQKFFDAKLKSQLKKGYKIVLTTKKK